MHPVSREQGRLAAAALKLAESVPFGSYGYIADRLSTVYTKLLTIVARESVAARALLDALDRIDASAREAVFRDSLTRRTIEDGVCKLVHGVDTIDRTTLDELLAAAAENAATPARTLLAEDAGPVQNAFGAGNIWAGRETTLPEQRFRGEILNRLTGFRIDTPSQEQIDRLVAAAALTERIVPGLARSALAHIFTVVIGEFPEGQRFKSLTVPGLPGVLFLSPELLATEGDAAEGLFHEALHLKFLDIDYIHPLFVPGFRQESSPRVTPVWHSTTGFGNWPVDRVLTSMHVYVSLAVFFGTAAGLKRSRYNGLASLPDADEMAARAEQCRIRAAWLFEAAQQHLQCLSAAGRDFVAMIGEMLALLDHGKLPHAASPPLKPT